MKHEWDVTYAPPGTSNATRFMSEPWRRCIQCGVIQQRHKEHAWGRIIAVRWLPYAGRCKGKS